jgi:adenosylhomocysteine nucleosidase
VTILVATGLRREQRLLEGPGVQIVVGGGDSARLEATLDRQAGGVTGIISIGIAGGLSPGLRAGQWAVASAVLDGDRALATDPAWAQRLRARLPGPTAGVLLGSDTIAAEASLKAELNQRTGAIAVDMESHIAARVAHRHRLPFAAARVVCDAAHRTLPSAALVGMRTDGSVDLPAVLWSLLRNPGQLPALIRTGIEAERGFRALLRGHDLLGPGLGGPDVGDLPLDMV